MDPQATRRATDDAPCKPLPAAIAARTHETPQRGAAQRADRPRNPASSIRPPQVAELKSRFDSLRVEHTRYLCYILLLLLEDIPMGACGPAPY
jgi:hypothetical protein